MLSRTVPGVFAYQTLPRAQSLMWSVVQLSTTVPWAARMLPTMWPAKILGEIIQLARIFTRIKTNTTNGNRIIGGN